MGKVLSTMRWMARFVLVAIFLAAPALWNVAVHSQGNDRLKGLSSKLVAVADGPSGLKWIGGESENQLMHPGLSCINCHAKGEGPLFSAAGTVYTNIDEKDDYFGVEGVTVQLTDSKGKTVSLTTNKAGNFFASARSATLVPPLKVNLQKGGATSAMGSPAPTGNCALCHTAKGENGAPGRVVSP